MDRRFIVVVPGSEPGTLNYKRFGPATGNLTGSQVLGFLHTERIKVDEPALEEWMNHSSRKCGDYYDSIRFALFCVK
jgi:hypothetical protein